MGAKVELNMAGVRAVLKSQEVAAELQKHGNRIAAQANAAGVQAFAEYHHGERPNCPPYQAKVNEHERMNVCIVRPVGKHGKAIENKHHILRGML